MFGRKALPFGTIVLVSIIALAIMGLGYAAWSTNLYDEGQVTAGTFGAVWAGTMTDDGGTQDDPTRDAGDIPCAEDSGCTYPTGPCEFRYTENATPGCSARDPMEAGPNAGRSDKAVGACWSGIDAEDSFKVLHWGVSDAYPGYYCTVWSKIGSAGSVPMKIQSAGLTYPSQIEIGYANNALCCGKQIDPNSTLELGMVVHVTDGAGQGATYGGTSSYTLVQWNEWSAAACGTLPVCP